MRFLLIVIFICATIGCSENERSTASAPAQYARKSAENQSRYMAYEHSVNLDVEEQRIASVHGAIEASCRADIDGQCVVLESRLNTGRNVSSVLKLRARPEGIRKLIASLSTQGQVINQSVEAEDLARPIEDSAKKLAMLNDYRSKLEALRGKAANDVDALIKVNKELALVQSEIEAMSGEKLHLLQRVETEILNVYLSAVNSRSFWRPITNAIADFGKHLSDGIASAITCMAFIVPWGLMLLLFWWVGCKLWFRRKKSSANA